MRYVARRAARSPCSCSPGRAWPRSTRSTTSRSPRRSRPVERARATTGRCSADNAGSTLDGGAARARRSRSRVGGGLGVAMHLVRPLRDAAYPLLVASQAIPIVVLAPIFVLAFDYGMRPEARDRRADLLLPDHRQPARRPALGGARAAQADAQHGRVAAAHAPLGRAARLAALPVQRPEGGRYGVGDRCRVRRVGRRPRRDSAGWCCIAQQPAPDRPRVYAGTVLLTADGDRAVRARRAGGATACAHGTERTSPYDARSSLPLAVRRPSLAGGLRREGGRARADRLEAASS